MRLFIAVELPEEIKDFLANLQMILKKTGADVKWVEAKNIHLTLKFLGEVDEEKIDKVIRILEETARDKDRFYIHLNSCGAFPNLKFPRVIWVGIDKGNVETTQIAISLEEKLAKLGIPKEKRPFSSHITLGRVKSGLNRQRLNEELTRIEKNLSFPTQEYQIKKIALFKSTLTPNGPIYEVIKEANLKMN
ncbi:MAG: RNA 2',3'-cyclic phosphodiesterase [Candidatus Omnitrophica bacterium]|nr:RNA 2',3'-cyclic phosphodiesterase [Candidatus Omnitrophota bacterium]